MNVSPECDCWGHNDLAIVPDLGMMASFDPVALDQACADMVNNAPSINGWIEKEKEHNCGCSHHDESNCCDEDKFKIIHPDTDWQAGLRYAEEIGLGSREYELVTV